MKRRPLFSRSNPSQQGSDKRVLTQPQISCCLCILCQTTWIPVESDNLSDASLAELQIYHCLLAQVSLQQRGRKQNASMLFALIFPSLYSSLFKHLLIDKNLSQLVALLTCASYSSLVLMSSLFAGKMETSAITAQDEAYLLRKKPTLTLNQLHHEQPVPHWCERRSLLILLQFPTRVFFWVSHSRRVHLWCWGHMDFQFGCETPHFLPTHTFSTSRAGHRGVLDIY